ncbi:MULTISPECIES: hypothetical protein [unclassified Mesorhizobium]|uniref:hypothetical protein n=1 Tax=unclassified Mesorhizobium TaxID=325217 RepID=UPI0012EC40FC|nr:hypothetical protein [Mesorhizobium sp. LSJC268A00]
MKFAALADNAGGHPASLPAGWLSLLAATTARCFAGGLNLVETLATWAAAASACVSAWYWLRASRESVPAPANTAGMGALFGGYIITRIDGERVDFHATFALQSRLNSNAARTAASTAGFTAISLVAKALGL